MYDPRTSVIHASMKNQCLQALNFLQALAIVLSKNHILFNSFSNLVKIKVLKVQYFNRGVYSYLLIIGMNLPALPA